MKRLIDHTTRLLTWTSRLTHIVISLALVTATALLVLFQGNKSGFSWSVSVQGKALLAANGRRPLQEEQRGHGR